MATESTTKTDKKTAAAAADERAEDKAADSEETGAKASDLKKESAGSGAKPAADEPQDAPADARDEDLDADLRDEDADGEPESGRTGLAAGAFSLVSAALGVASITGTSLSDQMQARKQLMGQIESQMGGGGGDQIQSMYGAPWHMTALFNGMFALAAVVVGGVLLAVLSGRGRTSGWARPVALGGLIIGVIGLLVSGGMFLDLFAPAPKLPGQ